MASRHSLLQALRTIHLYFGVLIAPSLIFFAFTGALQTFGLHENSRGGDYKAPQWAVVLGQIHKKQTAILPVRRPAPDRSATASASKTTDAGGNQPAGARKPEGPPTNDGGQQPKRHPLPLKIFFLVVCIGLVTSSLTGIYMAYKYRRNKTLTTALLVAGIILPVLLLFV